MKKIIVGLMGHSFHCSNLGVGALAISECELLNQAAEKLQIELEVICFESSAGQRNYTNASRAKVKLEYYTYSPKMIGKFRKCDMIIDATGGDSFSDIYGDKIFLVGLYFKFLSIMSGCPVILAPQTIGPFKKKSNGILANFYMKFVRKIFLRDLLSMEILNSANKTKMENTADMAFKLPWQSKSVKVSQSQSKSVKGTVGFNISGLIYDEKSGFMGKEGVVYSKLCDQIIELLLERGYKVDLVSHVIGDETTMADNDYAVSLLVQKKYPAVHIAPLFENPVQAKNYISSFDLFLGSRMHAVIAAISSGVPAIPIAYSRKFKGVFEPLGYDVTLDATGLNTEEMLNKVTYYVDNIEILQDKVAEIKNNSDKQLKKYENYLEQIMADIIKKGRK